MERVRLGRTDLEVSRICFGTWQLGGDWGAVEERAAVAAVRRALELGINFFDTAQAYGFGRAEELLGRALDDELRSRRDEVVLATKGGLRVDPEEGLVRDSSPEWLRRGVEDSLRLLGVDHVDLYQVHWPDPRTPLSETAGALQELVDAGKLRWVGVSNFGVEQMEELARTRPVDTLQPPYHLFRRDIEEEILPWCRDHDVGVLVYGPLAHGLLTGRFDEDRTFPPEDWRSGSELFRGESFRRNVRAVRELERLAEERGTTVTRIAIAWTLARPGVHAAIVGARRPDQIEGSAPAAELALDEADLAAIEDVMAGAAPVGGPSPEAAAARRKSARRP